MNNLMKKLTETNAIAANESAMQELLLAECSEYADEIIEDGLGSLIFHKKGTGPKIMIAVHMDEVGLLVKYITPEGMLIVIPIGAVRPFSMLTQGVHVTTGQNKTINGMLHTDQNDNKIYVDLGLDTFQEVIDLGIDIGDMVTFATDYQEINQNRFYGKALDNRAGCYALIQILKEQAESENDVNLFAVFTSSEEVGMRGGKTSTELIQPDYGLIIDVACARDEFNRDYTNTRQLGKGPMVLHYDKTLMPNHKLLNLAKEVAQKNNIPIQKDMFVNGGTDGGTISLVGSGVPSVVFGIPNRYGHGPISFGDYTDINTLIKLVQELCHQLK